MLLKVVNFFEDIFNAYPHQKQLFDAFFSGNYRFFIENIHRRGGKDATYFNLAWLFAAMERGNYLYTLPKIGQAKNVIWEGTDLDGKRWIDNIPLYLIKNINQTERKIHFTSGSILHVTGADSVLGAHLGSNLRGIFMSEFQRTAPFVWDYLRPIINRNPKGFAAFNYTSFGQCNAHRLRTANIDNPKWHTRKLTVDDTRDNNGNYIFSP